MDTEIKKNEFLCVFPSLDKRYESTIGTWTVKEITLSDSTQKYMSIAPYVEIASAIALSMLTALRMVRIILLAMNSWVTQVTYLKHDMAVENAMSKKRVQVKYHTTVIIQIARKPRSEFLNGVLCILPITI